jgi:lysosomal acid lipase/cholesteryl ester hydrolase
MRNAAFQMYDDDVLSPVVVTSVSSYRPVRFPTRNIVTPIVLLYGDADSLVDIHKMLAQLPSHTIAKRLHTYEHLDVLWGRDVHIDVIPEVITSLELYNTKEQTIPDVVSRDETTQEDEIFAT